MHSESSEGKHSCDDHEPDDQYFSIPASCLRASREVGALSQTVPRSDPDAPQRNSCSPSPPFSHNAARQQIADETMIALDLVGSPGFHDCRCHEH